MARGRGVERYEIDVGGETLVVTSVPLDETGGVLEGLSTAEREIAIDAVSGMSNAEIARKRNRAVRTVANQVASIFRKVGVGSRAELAARLVRGR
jgi:DNA-binding NarL/FixJ family response regulator